MLIKEIIKNKRDNKELTQQEMEFFVDSVVNGNATNEQISAFTMAVFFNKLNLTERKFLTLAMRNSGEVIEFEDLTDMPIVDKHSTGGVSDSVSLPLAPIVAACGAYVPMITGKGLGHTGGTTDKLNSIQGYNTAPTTAEFKKVVKEVGCAVIGQTANLAPADKRIYTIRDTTATVDSIDLICSSILSKKLASGIKNLVMDVKTGSGAFMQTIEDAENLAQNIVNIANSVGVPSVALITDMNEALGRNIGNSLEILETIDFLTNKPVDSKLKEVTMELAAQMLLISNIATTKQQALEKVNYALESGKAAQIFANMVKALGGSADIINNPTKYLPVAKYTADIFLNKTGVITNINNYELGMTLVHLGGGRKAADDVLDLSVGLTNVKKVGEIVDSSNPFATLHYNNKNDVENITNILNNCITVGNNAPKYTAIYKVINPN